MHPSLMFLLLILTTGVDSKESLSPWSVSVRHEGRLLLQLHSDVLPCESYLADAFSSAAVSLSRFFMLSQRPASVS